MTVQPGFCWTWLETQIVGFLMHRLKLYFQCSSLLNAGEKEDFIEDICEEYEEIRTDHYDSLKVTSMLNESG